MLDLLMCDHFPDLARALNGKKFLLSKPSLTSTKVTICQEKRYPLPACRGRHGPQFGVISFERKGGVQPISRSKDDTRGRVLSSHRAISLRKLKAAASQCRTPKRFRKLLDSLQIIIPYEKLAVSWGYPSSTTICYVFNHSFPPEFLRWYLATGALWKSPMFREWLRTRRVLMWCDVAKRLKAQFDPEMLKRVEQAHLQYSLCGGYASPDRFVWFNAAMASEQSGRAHLKPFEVIVPWLVKASQRAYPRTLLTKREIVILRRRAMGELSKQIAAVVGISDRTVRMHLQRIKKKLFTDDLVNAVVIACKSGMLNET